MSGLLEWVDVELNQWGNGNAVVRNLGTKLQIGALPPSAKRISVGGRAIVDMHGGWVSIIIAWGGAELPEIPKSHTGTAHFDVHPPPTERGCLNWLCERWAFTDSEVLQTWRIMKSNGKLRASLPFYPFSVKTHSHVDSHIG